MALLFFLLPLVFAVSAAGDLRTDANASAAAAGETVLDVPGGPADVVWVVQLSDLHFSRHHPDRARDFRRHIAAALAAVNPSLVLITGDLVDGKSEDMLTSKQDENEWLEYRSAMNEVIDRSGLDNKIFYDLRGNHDIYGLPMIGGGGDYYEEHSINARLGRKGFVHSITLQNSGRKHLFVGFDSTMGIGLRGPTNLFGKPGDELLRTIDEALSQWSDDERGALPLTKIAFGHFPMSFSASTESGRHLKDIFLKHSLAAYLCGHLHTNFGRNLKRHHTLYPQQHILSSSKYHQYNIHSGSSTSADNCSASSDFEEFWEWEMGDWRSARSMRIVAIDSGLVSYTDVDYMDGSRDIIIVPTFPLDSRFMQRLSFPNQYVCESGKAPYMRSIRALLFSKNEIVSVSVKIYDSRSGNFESVLDSEMRMIDNNGSRGNMFVAPWNWKAFVDESPDRYFLEIKAVDITGQTSTTELMPFSINGLIAKVHWTWKEFLVMGCQWDDIYHPMVWFTFAILFLLVLAPQASRLCFEKYYAYKYQKFKECRCSSINYCFGGVAWIGVELSKMVLLWFGTLLYLLFLAFLPWFSGHAIRADGDLMQMSHRGWKLVYYASRPDVQYVGTPDVMVYVIPHLLFVVLPAILILAALAAERTVFRAHYLKLAGKKEDDYNEERGWLMNCIWNGRWIRKFLFLICLAILWKHFKQCRSIVKAYEISPLTGAPVYCFWIPMLLAFGIYKTSTV